MISFLIPSRGRPDSLLKSIESLDVDTNGLEILVWLDSNDPKMKEYQELCKRTAKKFDDNKEILI